MHKYSFLDDYSEGCHPKILEALAKTNLIQQTAYGNDEYTDQAKNLIRQHIKDDNAAIYFVAGGTIANTIIIASALKSHEAVIAASSGHIVVRETGAIEATGHKIITVPSADGKLTPEDIHTAVAQNAHYPHMAKPRLVYISNATELGTLYSRAQLQALSEACKAHNLLLLLDGARLGVALTASDHALNLNDIATLTDIFWIGGTKSGALLGEAIVIPNAELAQDFAFHIKQRGALLAKGRLLGIQFRELFTNNLFFDLNHHANLMAEKLSQGVVDAGYTLAAHPQSNQIFPLLPNALIRLLQEKYDFYIWEQRQADQAMIRLVTSWATDEGQVDAFIALIKAA